MFKAKANQPKLQQQLDTARKALTVQDDLFTSRAEAYTQTVPALVMLAEKVHTDPDQVETDLRKLADMFTAQVGKIIEHRDATRKVLNNLGGRTDAK